MSKIQLKKEQQEIISNVNSLMEGKTKNPTLMGIPSVLSATQKADMKADTLAMMAAQYEVTIPTEKAIADLEIKQAVVMENKTATKRQTRSHMWGSALRTKRLHAEALENHGMNAQVQPIGFGNFLIANYMSAKGKEAAGKFADEIGVLANKDMKFKLDTDDDFIAAVPRLVDLKKQLDTLTRMEKARPEAIELIPPEVMSIYQTAKDRAIRLVNYYEAKAAVMTDAYYVTHYQSEISYSYNEADPEEIRLLSIKLWALEKARAQLEGSDGAPRANEHIEDVNQELTEVKRRYANELLSTEVTQNEKIDVSPLAPDATEEEKKALDRRTLACNIRMQTIAAEVPTPPGLCGAELLNMPLHELAANAVKLNQKYEDIRWILESYHAFMDAGANSVENTATASNIDSLTTFMAVYDIIRDKLQLFANGTNSYADCRISIIEEVMKLDNGAQIIENLHAGYRSTMFAAEQSEYKSDAELLRTQTKEKIEHNLLNIPARGIRMANKKAALVEYIDSLDRTHVMYSEKFWTLVDAYRKFFAETDEDRIAKAVSELKIQRDALMADMTDIENGILRELDDSFTEMDEVKTGTLVIPADAKIMDAANPATKFGAIYTSAKDRTLFPLEPTAHDIQQRTVADCYLLATLTGVANADPQKIMSMMKDEGDTVVVGFVVDDERAELYDSDGDSLQDTFLKNSDKGAECVLYRMISKVLSSDYVRESELINSRFAQNSDDDDLGGFVEVELTKEELVAKALTRCMYSNNPDYIRAKIDLMFNDRELGLNKLYLINQIQAIMTQELDEEEKEEQVREQVHGILQTIASLIEDKNTIDTVLKQKLRPDLEQDSHGFIAERHIKKMEYVRVTKEIPQYAGLVDAYASGPLWAQLYEKAYVAKFGNAEGYKSIAYRSAYEPLRHIYGIEYDNRDELGLGNSSVILRRFDNGAEYQFREFGRRDSTIHIMSVDEINEAIVAARVEMKEGIPTIESVAKKLSARHSNMSPEQEKDFAEFLSAHYGLNHETMSGKYTNAADAIMTEIGARIAHGETVVVGCNFTITIEEEERAAIYAHHEETGIRNEHAYTVIDVFENEAGKFITLRDPYARYTREYREITDEDGNRAFESVANTSYSLGHEDGDGIFNMELNDFLRTFNEFSGVRMA